MTDRKHPWWASTDEAARKGIKNDQRAFMVFLLMYACFVLFICWGALWMRDNP